ncbi:MAG TPA: hypothetical protein VKA53_11550 [Thermoanaerobaculia bacterium]|nr:hypothetical protein [Thermoanaerobaculia bacterium]
MAGTVQIYVRLTGTSSDAWRPVAAERLRGTTFRIVSQPYDRAAETWEFEPGDHVVCEQAEAGDSPVFAAVRKLGDEPRQSPEPPLRGSGGERNK